MFTKPLGFSRQASRLYAHTIWQTTNFNTVYFKPMEEFPIYPTVWPVILLSLKKN